MIVVVFVIAAMQWSIGWKHFVMLPQPSDSLSSEHVHSSQPPPVDCCGCDCETKPFTKSPCLLTLVLLWLKWMRCQI